ncbi:MAG: lipoyl synthase [Candidatus Latescibacterota bacterium]|nr:MAG: lipoyl synthase [Candidatus Latescibacterota bacterium]
MIDDRSGKSAATRVPRPPWLKIRLETGAAFREVRSTLRGGELHTVCEEARCPNQHECWGNGTATFLILGEICTRACGFCAVTSGRPAPLDPNEPDEVAEAVARLGLRFAVITAVDRDDLADLGAGAFARTVQRVRERNPDCEVEVLIPDFDGREDLLREVIEAGPIVVGHNTEVVPRLYPRIRFRHTFERTLGVLAAAARLKQPRQIVKSGLMVGIGEEDGEVEDLLRALRGAGVEAVTIGQYLQPTKKHHPVVRYVHPETFDAWRDFALRIGFLHVESGPLVRSSYRAERIVGAIGAGRPSAPRSTRP